MASQALAVNGEVISQTRPHDVLRLGLPDILRFLSRPLVQEKLTRNDRRQGLHRWPY